MSLEKLRKKIDDIDAQIIDLFQKRMALSKEIATYKKLNNIEIFDEDREKIVIEKNTKFLADDIKDFAKIFLKNLMDLSKTYQNKRNEND